MSGSRIVFDGLWRCLCPSVDPKAASKVLNARVYHRRLLSTTVPRRPRTPATRTIDAPRRTCRRFGGLSGVVPPATSISDLKTSLSNEERVETILRAAPKDLTDKFLGRAAPDDLFRALQMLHDRPGAFKRAAIITKHLIVARGAKPSPQLYECLIACARDPAASADMISQLLAEMRQLKIPTGSLLIHDALEALAIHPNYILRNEIIWAMKQTWTALEPRGEAAIAIGLLRDGQYELAFDMVEHILDSTAHPPPWLFDIFVLVFARQGFLDEAVRLANAKLSTTGGVQLPKPLYLLLLEECARNMHHLGAKYVWSQLLDRSRVPDGTLLHLLNTAARHADPELAVDVTNVLSARGARLGPHHYEAVIDAYTAAGDVSSALRVLCIMNNALSAVPEQSTRTIYTTLIARPGLLPDALDALALLNKEHKPPIQAVNVLIEAAIATRNFTAAFEIYASLGLYTRSRADAVTLSHLLAACDNTDSLKVMVARDPTASLKANPDMFERAVYEFALAGDLDEAYSRVALLAKAGLWVTRDTALTVLRRSLDARDERVWDFVAVCTEKGLDMESAVARMSGVQPDESPDRREVTRGKRVIIGGSDDDSV